MAEQALSEGLVKRSIGLLGRREARLGYALVAPVVICLLLLVFYPFVFAIWISFTDRMIGRPGRFVGLANYAYLFGQPSFQATIRNTVVLVVSVQALKLVLSLGIALLLNQPIRGRQFWRSLILLPWAMPAFVAYITWKLLYAPQGGAFNMILLGTGLASTHVDFLSTRELAMPSVIVATFWRGFPFWVISFLAAMQNVSDEM
jgi:ABC-type sugar transport system permease subunit